MIPKYSFVIVAAWTFFPCLAQNSKLDSPTFNVARDPALDIDHAVLEAKKTEKHILIEVGGDWCPWCHELDRLLQEHPELRQLRDENFVTVKVYYNSDNRNGKTLSRYPKLLGIPHLFVLDYNGAVLHSQHALDLQLNGTYSAEKMKAFLVRWSPPQAGGTRRSDTRPIAP